MRLAAGWMMDWVRMEAGGWYWVLQVGGQRRTGDMDPLWRHFKKVNSPEMGDEYKTKKKPSLLFGAESYWQVGRAERGKGEKEIG